MPEPQSFKNHARFDPPQHFVTVPILLLNFIACIVFIVRTALQPEHPSLALPLWITVVSFALLVGAVNTRIKDLRVQDRLIRLEEQFRYVNLLQPAELAASSSLTVRQIVALRFASDTELPALLKRSLAENLSPKQIKESILSWRPDNLRV